MLFPTIRDEHGDEAREERCSSTKPDRGQTEWRPTPLGTISTEGGAVPVLFPTIRDKHGDEARERRRSGSALVNEN